MTAEAPGRFADAPETASWYYAPEEQHSQFRGRGVAMLRYMDPALALQWADRLAAANFPRIERWVDNDGAVGRRAAHVGDEDAVLAALPEVAGALPGIRLLAETVVRRPVILSPHRSGITGKVYEPGDEQGPHRDSNPLTALLVLQGPAPVFAELPSPAGLACRVPVVSLGDPSPLRGAGVLPAVAQCAARGVPAAANLAWRPVAPLAPRVPAERPVGLGWGVDGEAAHGRAARHAAAHLLAGSPARPRDR